MLIPEAFEVLDQPPQDDLATSAVLRGAARAIDLTLGAVSSPGRTALPRVIRLCASASRSQK